MTEINEELKADVGSSAENTTENASFHYNDPVEMQAAAIAYARAKFACVPIWPMVPGPDGKPECGCMAKERKHGNFAPLPCTQPAKHPMTGWKFDTEYVNGKPIIKKDADGNPIRKKDYDEGQVRRLWDPVSGKYRGANIGLKTGSNYGIVPVDYDGETGQQNWGAYKTANGITHIETPEDISGSGKGGHVFFSYDGPEIPNSASLLGPHIDTRGKDGLIFVWPSNHKSGGQYRWIKGRALGEVPLEKLPQCIIDDLAKARPAESAKGTNKSASKRARRDSDYCDTDPFEEAGEAMRTRAAGLDEHLALIGDGEDQAGFDNPILSTACCFFAKEGDDAPAETIKEILRKTILAAPCDNGRAEDRYATDRYLDPRIEQARDFIKGANEAKYQRVLGEVERIALLVSGFTKATDEKKIGKAYQALAAIADEAPPGMVSDVVVKLGKASGRNPAVSKKYLDAIVKGIRDEETGKQAEEKRLADNEAATTGGALDKKPMLILGVDNFADMVSTSWARLEAVNAVKSIYYEMGGAMVRLGKPDVEGKIKPIPLGIDGLWAELNELVLWKAGDRFDSAEKKVPAHIFHHDNYHFPAITKIVYAPFFTQNDELISQRGCCPDAAVFYQPTPGFTLPSIPDNPTDIDVKEARDLIEDHMLGEFPWSDGEFDERGGRSSKAHAIALLLTQFMREMIPGDLPIFFVQKPEAGSGASLLIKSLMRIALGRVVAGDTQPEDDAEARKKITAFLMSGDPILFIDNVNEHFHGAPFAHFQTCGTWSDRILSTNQRYSGPVTTTTIVAGNRVAMSAEIARRCVPILLDAREDPKARSIFRYDLNTWVPANRVELVVAVLTLIKAWIAKGKPEWRGKPLPSFEGWSRVMGGVLASVGVDGFLGNLEIATDAASGDEEPWGDLCALWFDKWGNVERLLGVPYPVGKGTEWDGENSILRLVEQEVQEIKLSGDDDKAKAASLGLRLKRNLKVHKAPDGRQFRLAEGKRIGQRKKLYRVELVGDDSKYSRAAADMLGRVTWDELTEADF